MFNVQSSGDIDCGLLVSEGELALFSMCKLLATQTVACLVSGCELAWFSICTLLVTHTVACLVSVGELA